MGVGTSAGSRQAAVLRMQDKATEGVNGRLANNQSGPRLSGNGEAALVFPRARGHTAPLPLRGSAQFGAHGEILRVAQQEDGIGSGVGVEAARLEERFQQSRGDGAPAGQVMFNPPKTAGRWRGQS